MNYGWPELRAVRPAAASERDRLINHLKTDSNALGWARQIEAGQRIPLWALVKDREALGNLSTAFSELGSDPWAAHASVETGRTKFLVREAYEVWRRTRGDEVSVARLERYLRDEKAGELVDRTITLVADTTGLRIVDGNKRAVAIFEASAGRSDFTLDVFILVR